MIQLVLRPLQDKADRANGHAVSPLSKSTGDARERIGCLMKRLGSDVSPQDVRIGHVALEDGLVQLDHGGLVVVLHG